MIDFATTKYPILLFQNDRYCMSDVSFHFYYMW